MVRALGCHSRGFNFRTGPLGFFFFFCLIDFIIAEPTFICIKNNDTYSFRPCRGKIEGRDFAVDRGKGLEEQVPEVPEVPKIGFRFATHRSSA